MGGWTDAGSHWTYSPFLAGDEDPNLPPPSVRAVALRGKPYTNPQGIRYNTWEIPKTNADGSVTWQTIVDWASIAT